MSQSINFNTSPPHGEGLDTNQAVAPILTKDDLLEATSSNNPKEHCYEVFEKAEAVTDFVKSCLPLINTYVESLSQSWAEIEGEDEHALRIPCSWECASDPPPMNIPVKFGVLRPDIVHSDHIVYSNSWGTLPDEDKFIQVAVLSSPPDEVSTFGQATTGAHDTSIHNKRPLNIYNNVYPGIDSGDFFETHNAEEESLFDVLYMATDNPDEQHPEACTVDKNPEKQSYLGFIAPGTKAADITSMTPRFFSQALAACCFSQLHNKALESPSPTCFLKIPGAQGQNAYVNFTDGWFSVVMDKPNVPDN